VVAAFLSSGKSIAEVAREYQQTEETLRKWVREAADAVVSAELAGPDDAGSDRRVEPDVSSPEYQAQVVAWYLTSRTSLAEVASALNLSESTVREWVWNATPDAASTRAPLPAWAERVKQFDDSGRVPEVVEPTASTDRDAGAALAVAEAAEEVARARAEAAEARKELARAERIAAKATARADAAAEMAAEATARAQAAAEAVAAARAETAAARMETAAAYAAAVEAVLRAQITAAETVGRAEASAAEAMAKAEAVAAEGEMVAARTLAQPGIGGVGTEAFPIGVSPAQNVAGEDGAAAKDASGSQAATVPRQSTEPERIGEVERTVADALPRCDVAVAGGEAEAEARAKIAEVMSRMAQADLWVRATARTEAEARAEALGLLGVDEAQAEFEVLSQGLRWLPGRVQVRARIRVSEGTRS